MTAPLPDAVARRRIESEHEASFFVEAAAGTGKTTALVGRIVSLLRAGGAELEGIAALTFTEKAAGEMKLRLRARIEQARSESSASQQERRRLDRALQQLELARIGTIHAFCADLLRERPVEAGVDPLFEVAAEEEAEELLEAAFEDWFQRVLADPPEGVRRVLRRRGQGPAGAGPREQLRRAVASLVEHRDFAAPWRRSPFDREAAIDALWRELRELGPLARRAASPRDWLARSFEAIGRFVEEVELLEAVREGRRDYDGLEARLRDFASGRQRHWRWTGGQRPYAKGLPRQALLARRDAARAALQELLERSAADLAPLLQRELQPVLEAYRERKRRAGRLDFVDLLLAVRDLIVQRPEVRRDFQRRTSHFFVDEFQDTDPLQAEILLLLAADDPEETDWLRAQPVPGKLFVVGDPKQSIYRFRRADVAIYEETKRRLVERGAETLQLSASFRALPSLQQAINAAFEPAMDEASPGIQARYVPLEPVRAEATGRPSLVALPVPRPYGDYGSVVQWRIEDSAPDAIAAYVDWLVRESGWSVEDPERPGRSVALAPRHVCLLFRRFRSFETDVTRLYVRGLEARGIPHVLVGGRSFHDREEVLALRNALVAIEWPDDALRVYATLRGPLFALGDDALLAYRERFGSLHPLRPRGEATLEDSEVEVAEALDVLAELHRQRNRRPAAATLGALLEAVRAHAGIAIWPTGEQALANCLRSLDLARRFERRGATSFRAFVERVEADAERGEARDAPVVEEGTEGVRIMTAHRAKGLEFPVVVLADPTAMLTGREPTRHVDVGARLWAEPLCGCVPVELREAQEEERARDAAESVRLAYVAATRARELLVVPVLGDGCQPLEDRWQRPLLAAVYPEPRARREAGPAPGCPDFGQDSVLERPDAAGKGASASVAPGLHRSRAGTPVVWWDPAQLSLGIEARVGLRQERILHADESGTNAESGERAHEAWQARRLGALESGLRASLEVHPVTTLAEQRPPDPEPPVLVESTDRDRSRRPGGRRFGSLVHAVLAVVDLRDAPARIRAAAEAQGRLLGCPEEEVAAAAEAVEAALEHPLLVRAARSDALRRETPVLLRLPDGALGEGVVDLAFREPDVDPPHWTVVDFKTDRELAARRPVYESQVQLYARAVQAATGEPCRGALLVL